jgi:hypothetical protein
MMLGTGGARELTPRRSTTIRSTTENEGSFVRYNKKTSELVEASAVREVPGIWLSPFPKPVPGRPHTARPSLGDGHTYFTPKITTISKDDLFGKSARPSTAGSAARNGSFLLRQTINSGAASKGTLNSSEQEDPKQLDGLSTLASMLGNEQGTTQKSPLARLRAGAGVSLCLAVSKPRQVRPWPQKKWES